MLWPPVPRNVTTDQLDIPYLDITDQLTVRVNPEEERLHFWDAMTKKYTGELLP